MRFLIVSLFIPVFFCCKNRQQAESDPDWHCSKFEEIGFTARQIEILDSYLKDNRNPPKKINQFCLIPIGEEIYNGKKIGMYDATLGSHLPGIFILKHVDDSLTIISKIDTQVYESDFFAFLKKHQDIIAAETREKMVGAFRKNRK